MWLSGFLTGSLQQEMTLGGRLQPLVSAQEELSPPLPTRCFLWPPSGASCCRSSPLPCVLTSLQTPALQGSCGDREALLTLTARLRGGRSIGLNTVPWGSPDWLLHVSRSLLLHPPLSVKSTLPTVFKIATHPPVTHDGPHPGIYHLLIHTSHPVLLYFSPSVSV